MERTDLFDLMDELKLYGMRLAYDEVIATGIKRQHEPPQIVGDLLNRLEAEARSGMQGRLAGSLARLDFIVLDELGYLPIA
jgi:hypothetical protein